MCLHRPTATVHPSLLSLRNDLGVADLAREAIEDRTQVKALAWHGKHDIRCETAPDPKIEHPRDAIIRVTSHAICGSDLHIFNGIIPRMESGDVRGHETLGEVVEVGAGNAKLKVGDRVGLAQ